MKRKISHKKIFYLVLLLISCGMISCGGSGEGGDNKEIAADSSGVQIYYLNKEETALVSQLYDIQEEEMGMQIQELITQLQMVPENVDMKAPLRMGFAVTSYQLEGKQIVLHLDEAYRQLSPASEILVRAAMVRTLTQIKGVDCLSILVGEAPLTDQSGNPVGVLTADMFIDNQGSEINAYEQINIKLYFANEAGNGLVETDRLVVYNSNISIERVVLDQLILGPSNMESYPTVNPNTKINSVTITDGVCYVNLDSSFLLQPYNVTADVAIYSVVNSLAELSNVNKVQFMIDGETAVQYRENISFETIFIRNLDLVE